MANTVETSPFSSSSSFNVSINEKPLILRIKRKASQSRFEAFWLEINETPLKQTLSDFQRLSVSDSTGKGQEITDEPLKQTLSYFGKLSISDLTGKGLEINERPLRRPFFDFGKLSVSETPGKGLEINEKPLKRPLLDFGKLSMSDLTGKAEMKNKIIFMQRVETVHSFEATIDVLRPFMDLAVDPSFDRHVKQAGEKCNHAIVLKDDLGYVCSICGVIEGGIETIFNFLYVEGARTTRICMSESQNTGCSIKKSQNTENGEATEAYHNAPSLAKNAHFEQIRRRRKGKEEVIYDESLHEKCQIYDIVRVDIEETSNAMEEENISLEEKELLSPYLSLMRVYSERCCGD